MANDYAYYSKNPTLWEEASQALWGGHDICPLLPQFMVTLITRWEISALSHKEVWGMLRGSTANWPFSLSCLRE